LFLDIFLERGLKVNPAAALFFRQTGFADTNQVVFQPTAKQR